MFGKVFYVSVDYHFRTYRPGGTWLLDCLAKLVNKRIDAGQGKLTAHIYGWQWFDVEIARQVNW